MRDRPQLTEANFWVPSGLTSFKAISEGEPFLFKTKKGENKLVGGGFLSGWANLPVSEAWEVFGEANGVPDRHTLAEAINRYRMKNGKPAEPDPLIGCVLLRDTFFVPADLA